VGQKEALEAVQRIAERDPIIGRFFRRRVEQSNYIRAVLKRDRKELSRIVGGENMMLSYAAREGFSTDSTGHRGFVTEAVFSPPTTRALQGILTWCHKNRVPAIPYGAGGGYNMGVVPKVPAVTIWPTALRTIGPIEPAAVTEQGRYFSIEVETGVPYEHLVDDLAKRGFAVRCVPNTPRASVGGVVATGSNGGKRIAEIVLDGEAVLADGRLVRFATTSEERRQLKESPFPLIHKFHGAPPSVAALRAMLQEKKTLPSSLFVASEGTTSIITKVRLAVEKRPRFGMSVAIWFDSLDRVPDFARMVNSFDQAFLPVYFELLTEPAISQYLASDYPDLFGDGQSAYVTLSFESDHLEILHQAQASVSSLVSEKMRIQWVGPYPTENPPAAATRLAAPREALPGKLRTKCKADVEVLLSHLPDAIRLLSDKRTKGGDIIESILFGHLSLQHSAIIHWNIGGIDLSAEETAVRAWDHLEETLTELIDPDHSGVPRACFTGEHGASGKPGLFRRSLSRSELARIYRIKRVLDPRRILNPATLYLPTRISRALHGRALAAKKGEDKTEARIVELVDSCTRCNACQSCIVLDAQADLRSLRAPRRRGGWLTGKRHLLQLLELLHSSEVSDEKRNDLLSECRTGLEMCISCGRCDVACPVDISLAELKDHLFAWSGQPASISRLFAVLYRLLLAPTPRSFPLLLSNLPLRAANHLSRLAQHAGFSGRALAGYLAFPPLGWKKYRSESGPGGIDLPEELGAVGAVLQRPDAESIAIRFRGCVGTIGRTEGTRNEDLFLAEVAGLPFLDFRPDLCCGYPHQSSGAFVEAREQRSTLIERLGEASREARILLGAERTVVFSSCPTCQESLRLGLAELASSEPHFTVVDPAELLMNANLPEGMTQGMPTQRIGLKVPCHAIDEATNAQLSVLQRFGFDVVCLDQCCGMAGTGRLKHPEIGLALATSLGKTIDENQLGTVVSGCPSCRDGVVMQATLEKRSVRVRDLFGILLTAV
jgi:FAD/FMN-containing dehydrogenase/Fe-S oxidoreductase